MESVLARLEGSRPLRWACVASLLALVVFLDWRTGIELSFSLFYLLPVMLATWVGGRGEGLSTAVLSTAAWFVLDDVIPPGHYSHPLIPVWNALIRGAYFCGTAWVVVKIKDSLEDQRRASQLKSEMLAFASHELNNSLTSLGMGVFLLQEDPGDGERQNGVLASLGRTVEHMKLATANFLEAARLESGKFVLDRRPCELRSLVANSLELLLPIAEKKGVAVRSAFPPEVVHLNADPDALSVVMANLIGNAVKYTPSGGNVEVSLGREPAGGELVTVLVKDSGIGMTSDEVQAVMSGFRRTAGGRREAKGYGLGLSIVRRLLQEHGTALEVKSSPGAGTTFCFRLPRAQPGAAAPPR